jgi:hypothetical protein
MSNIGIREGTVTTGIEVARTAHRVIADYMAVKPGEVVVIVVDDRTSPSIWQALAAQTLAVGGDPVVTMMAPRAKSGMEPPAPIAAAMCKGHVVIAAASRSMYHIEAKNRRSRRARAASSMRLSRTPGSAAP